MAENKKLQNDSLSKKHFAKIHERVQNKYVEMQKKLEKSRSVESLQSLSDNSFRYSRNSVDVDACDDQVFERKCDVNVVKYSVVVEDVNKQDATVRDCEVIDVPIYEPVISPVEEEQVNGDELLRDNWNLNLESVFEACNNKQPNENIELIPIHDSKDVHPTSPVKPSLRHRIGERLSAAKERRKEAREKKKGKEQKLILSNKLERSEIMSREAHTKKKNKVASVAVAVIEATGPENESPDKAAEEKPRQLLYCRIRSGTEKRKTKIAKIVGHKASWQELFNFNLYDDYLLDVTVWDKDTFQGRCTIDLKSLKEETTYQKHLELEECATKIQLFMLVTISGTDFHNLITESGDDSLKISSSGVGWLKLNVYEASGLPNTPDTYCVVELVNQRNQTQTEYKTSQPKWMKQFFYDISDVTSILSVTVFEEKKSGAIILGRVLIPLLSIENGMQKWYTLKDNTLTTVAKGVNPKILLKLTLLYNPIKASARVLSPKEAFLISSEPEFDRRLFANNITRAKVIVSWVFGVVKIVKGLFEWESQLLNITTLLAWLTFWWNFEQWMLPLLLLIPFLEYPPSEKKPRILNICTKIFSKFYNFKYRLPKDNVQDNIGNDKIGKKKEQDEKKEENKSLLQKVRSWTELATTVQTDIGNFASFGESVKNLYNFSVPFLSKLAIILIMIITIFLFFIPARYILMGWGVHKYLRKILRPNRIPNNEILDLLSRVPDDETLLQCQELTQNGEFNENLAQGKDEDGN